MGKKAPKSIQKKITFSQQNKDWEEQDQTKRSQPKPKNTQNGFAPYSFFPNLFLNIMINKLRNPTPVQKKTIPLIMQGKDVVVCYKTGSGKTLSYLLPLINKLQSHSQIVGARALILIPTRDLATQITKVLKTFLHKIDLRYCLLLGGFVYEGQFENLSINPDIIIATPGRLRQLIEETDLTLSRVQTIIFDQADQLFKESRFQNDLKDILQKCPPSQRLLFSATITPDLTQFTLAGLRDYSYVHQQIALPETMKIDFFVVRPQEKTAILLYFLENVTKREKVILFVSTRFHVDYLIALLGNDYDCYGAYGKMDMDQRTFALDNFRRRKGSILIVTDVAARGLDIPQVNFVIHFDYPSNHQIFVHRSGRTARNEKVGRTLAIITYHQLPYLIELSTFVTKKLANQSDVVDCINYGIVPPVVLVEYVNIVASLKQKYPQVKAHQEVSAKAYQKFKKCRAEASQNSMKKAKNLPLRVHYSFAEGLEQQQQNFLQKIKKFAPKKSFLQMQKIMNDIDPQTDPFLKAVEKIRKEQDEKHKQVQKKQKLRERNASKWKEFLDQKQINEFQNYREEKNRNRMPINLVEGVNIQFENTKKSAKKDFRNMSQYISATKNTGERTEFDDLPKIKTTDIDAMIQDQNPVKQNKNKRVWDKTKKNFVWQRDQENQFKKPKDDKGKKAYQQWKKKFNLAIPKAGQMENQEQTQRAQQSWKNRRMARHGWKENKEKGVKRGRDLKNNKTKAVQKRMKTRLINKSKNSKGGKAGGKMSGRMGGKTGGRAGSKMGGKKGFKGRK